MGRYAHVAIAVPSHDKVDASFAFDLARLFGFSVAAMPDEARLGVMTVVGTYVHAARNDLIRQALEERATHVLWIDSDMRFPMDALVRLLQHGKPVVGINYAQRAVDGDYVAIKEVGQPGRKCPTTEESSGLEEVDAVGFGLVLVRADALNGLPDPEEVPWFQNVYLGDGVWMGEDVHFCKLLKEAGHSIYVDHDLSKECRHIGSFEYDLRMVGAENDH